MGESISRAGRFLAELKRRRVFQVAVVYAAVAFVVSQLAGFLLPALRLPEWTMTLIVVILMLGFPVAVVLAWVFDITPEGIQRTSSRPAIVPPPRSTPAPPPLPSWGAPDLAPGRRSIAVLPFANLSGDPANEYFSDGITEEMVTTLARIRDLRVISRTSVMRYKHTSSTLREIAAELGVATILEGSVRREGDRVRIMAQLVDGATDSHLWTQSYDRKLEDIFAVQSEVATSVARALEAKITIAEQRRMEQVPTRDLAAYEFYLRARHHFDRLTAVDLRSAVTLFEEALVRDPGFALAHVGLAQAHLRLPYYASVQPALVFRPARAAVDRALALDPELAEAHAAAAGIRLHYDWEWADAEAGLERARALSDHSSWVPIWAATYAALRERFDEALARVDEVLARDPFSSHAHYLKAIYLATAGRAAEALPVARALVERDPEFAYGHFGLASTLLGLGRPQEAIPSYRRAVELMGGYVMPLGALALAHAAAGEREEAARILAELRSRADAEWVDPYPLAMAALAVGKVDLALDYLEEGERERSFLTLWIRPSTRHPAMRPLRAHPRLQALLCRIWPDDFPAAQPTPTAPLVG